MVTKKTRWLSAIAAVIMLVSMLAGIVVPVGAEIPADAASGSAILNALQKKYAAFEPDHFVVEVNGYAVEDARDKIAKLIEDYNGAPETDHWIYEDMAEEYDRLFIAANDGNVKSDLIVRYSLKEEYEAMGYDPSASTYYISDAEDWNAAAAADSMFIGKTLLVTNDIDFKGGNADPLTANEMAFQGVLDGQGFRFSNMVINIGDADAEKTYKYGGLVAALTGGTIKNLGLDGGELIFAGEDTVTDRNEGVGSFAGYIGKEGLLQNCWSTMTVTNNTKKNSKGQTTLEGAKNGVSGLIGWGEGGAIDHCFFAGTVNNTGSKRGATDLITYTANAVKVYNSIGAGFLNCDETCNPAAIGIHYNAYTDTANFGIYNSYAVGKNAIRHRANYNPYSYKTTDDDGNTKYINYVELPDADINFTKDIVHKYTPEACNAAYMMDTLEEAVWAVNRRFDTTHQSERNYFISLDENGKLCMENKKDAKNYRKVTIEGSVSGVYYFKEGTKVNLLNDLGLLVADSVTVNQREFASALNGYDLTVPAGDITITVTYTLGGEVQLKTTELTKKVEKYKKLDFELFDCADALNVWMAAAEKELAKSEKDLAMIEVLLEMESGEEGFAKNMALAPNKYPAAQDYEIYQEFNTAKEWAIDSPKDWLVMIDLSKTHTFEGETFHVRKDIDFNGQQMAPMNYFENQVGETDSTLRSFKGTIEGHGNAFINVNVYAGSSKPDSPVATAAGLIGKLGTGAVIRNFGVESGTIEVASRDYDQASTFGEMVGAATLTKVWSGATIICETGGSSGSHGIIAHSQYSLGLVNGAYFYGTLITTGKNNTRALAIAGDNMRDMSVFNTLSAPIVSQEIENSKAYAGIRYSSTSNTYFGNNYGVNIPGDYENIGNANATDMVASVVEGACKINRNNSGLIGEDGAFIKAVYFTIKDGKVAFGADDGSDQIRKITFVDQGVVIGEMYAAGSSEVVLKCDMAKSFDSILVGSSSVLNGSTLELGNEDVTIEITIDNEKAVEKQAAVVRELMAKYEALEPEKFDNGSEVTAWLDAAQEAIDNKDLVALYRAEETEAALAAATTLKEGFLPTFTEYEKYKEFNKNNEWLITSKGDWDAMDDYAEAAPAGEYFKGFTFYLNEDVDFEKVEMLPLGLSQSGIQKIFAGTIDGQGHGFKNVNIKFSGVKGTYYEAGDSMIGSIGLIGFLGACTIKDFGVYSGTIVTSTGSGAASVSTFGCVATNTIETAPIFTRVWSGATLQATSNAHVNGLVGGYNNTNGAVKVNGFIFNGAMNKNSKSSNADKSRNSAYAVYGGAGKGTASDNGVFHNILVYPGVNTEKENVAASFIFAFSDETTFKTAMETGAVKNVYGWGDIEDTYRVHLSDNTNTAGATTFDGVDYNLIKNKDAIKEIIWSINNNQIAGQEPVYFTTNDGAVWFGTAENQIRRVVVKNGEETIKTFYAMAGETITLDKLEGQLYQLPEGSSSTLDGTTLTVGNENVVINVVTCSHKDATYTFVSGTETHITQCKACGEVLIEDCVFGSWIANDDFATADGVVTAGTHTASCKYCGESKKTEPCVGTLTYNAQNCENDATFSCEHCDRKDVTVPNSGRQHIYDENNWQQTPDGKEFTQCLNCTVTKERGKVSVSANNEVMPGKSVNVTVTLPALKNATIKIAPTNDTTPDFYKSKYEITNVEDGDLINGTLENGTYTAILSNVQVPEGTTITVTVLTDKSEFVEGLLKVEVTDAENAQGSISDTTATAAITYDGKKGDADLNEAVNLIDTLAVLQHCVDSKNKVHIANADANNDGDVTVNDAPEIIRIWALTLKRKDLI